MKGDQSCVTRQGFKLNRAHQGRFQPPPKIMSTKIIHLTDQLPDEDVDRLAGQLLDDTFYDTLIDYDADVFKPNGEPLIKFRKGVIPEEQCRLTFPIWELAATPTDNRGMAAGGPREARIKADGTKEKRTRTKQVLSGIAGFMDNNPAFPYCRLTAFNANHMDQFNLCMPMITLIDETFKDLMPDRHAAQMEYHNRTSKDFKLPGTSFTTITVNSNFRTAGHRDAGDLKAGFGVMTALRAGRYKGGYLIFPKYRVAVDMQTTDIICADVHELHANSPIVGIAGTYKRISLVFYYREKIATCGTAEEERQKAINRTEGLYQRQADMFAGVDDHA